VCGQGNSYHFSSIPPSHIPFSDLMGRQRAPLTPIVLLIGALAIPACLAGQSRGTVRGTVTDAGTGAPLANTNVYLSSTTLGTNTGGDGKYVLTNIPAGMFDIVASRVGHRVKSASIHIAPAETLRADFSLEPVTLQGEEVQVVAHVNREWRRLLAKFMPAFLGRGMNAAGCTILNPEVLDFRMEKGTTVLVACMPAWDSSNGTSTSTGGSSSSTRDSKLSRPMTAPRLRAGNRTGSGATAVR